MSGVGNGGRTGGSVTIKNPNKQAEANINGEAFGFAFGDALTREGRYRIGLIDAVGNATEIQF
ncbi:MAG: hypothetical protein LBL66_01415 [Clostridiales bacterium]|nr:hypothetical protein [Clostridiales bacterium]